ncbi:MAG: hypothetical protein JWQ12_1279 [Glaciihabitans sp.]|nr:hypothetical protein [Glaciihabitans sp.]
MVMRRVLGALVALGCVGLLSACSLSPALTSPSHDDSEKVAAVQMQHIANAVKHHDASALKKLFSQRARENATDLDSGLDYFLSVFPPGKLTWESQGTGGRGDIVNFQETEDLLGNYKVTVAGKDFELSFVDFSIDTAHPDTVGHYALGVAPASEDGYTASGARKPFNLWFGQFGIKNHKATGHPGVYVPQK